MKRSYNGNNGGNDAQRRRLSIDENGLREAIKAGQRTSTEWKETWRHWCESQGHRNYDPMKHSPDFLQGFFKMLGNMYLSNASHFPQPGPTAMQEERRPSGRSGSTFVASSQAKSLVDLVKAGQRSSDEWKEAWPIFCAENAGGNNDPSKQSNNPVFFIAFCFRYGLSKLGSEEWAQPFMSAVSNTAHPLIVDAIKQGQRASESWKEAWGAYVEEIGSNYRDPTKHDADSLLQFMDTVAMVSFSHEEWMQPFVTGGQNDRMTIGNVSESRKGLMVNAIKHGQKMSESWRAAWGAYVEEIGSNYRDPTKHDEDSLLQFMDTVAMVSFSHEEWMQPFLTGGQNDRMTIGNKSESRKGLIIDVIKQGQRACESWKEAWGAYVEKIGSNYRDPTKHDEESLLQFMDTVAMVSFWHEEWMQPFVTGGQNDRMTIGNKSESRKGSMVNAIKKGQRASESWKEAWGAYVEKIGSNYRDPTKHDVESLLQFMDTVAKVSYSHEEWMQPFV